MKLKTLQLFKTLSIVILLLTIGLTIWAYFKMDALFTTVELKAVSVEFQLFVLSIITSASASFFISWRLILVTDAVNADVKADIDESSIDIEVDDEEITKYTIDWDSLCNNTNIEKYPDTDIEPLLQQICRHLKLDLGMVFKLNTDNEFENVYNYAFFSDEKPQNFKLGEGLHGQVAMNMKAVQLIEIPDNYVKITSASGFVLPKNIYMIPIVNDGKTVLYFEFADMKVFKSNTFELLNEFVEKITNKIF
ncbi:MAG: hypothetical protein DRI86_05480 [Bacteroidetes bacterium]|nr:MAG: hypothetical protein DRI86_05480 [Bacteroidota bacterium]